MNGQQQTQTSILGLPLAPSLPEFLNADPAVPNVNKLLSMSSYDSSQAEAQQDPESSSYVPKPSLLRRSRQVRAHFTYTTPSPVSFPYSVKPEHVQPRRVDGEAVGDGSAVKDGARDSAEKESGDIPKPKSVDIEDYLASLEPTLEDGIAAVDGQDAAAYTSHVRKMVLGTPKLLGVSQKCLDDILPNLDVGDAFEHLKTASDGEETASRKRKELTDFVAGRTVRLEAPSEKRERGFAPWSLCYGGHQFGSWAAQLGDGRAISIMTTPAKWPVYTEGTYYPPVAELQLKGAGRTPYSRFADGLAVLRSSIREYLGSEAMAALRIPTSRALSLVHLPDVEVQRESMETAAIVCRIVPSWLRIGAFELPWSRDDWDGLRDLLNYAGTEVFGFGKPGVTLKDEPEDKSLAAKVLRETSRRNARTFAGWQAMGFMHGVLNTDNISILGLTIDYGPYAFMDKYNANHICNHSDGEGRYSYRNQPPIGHEAVQRMGHALAEMIGYELEQAQSTGEVVAAPRGWAAEVDKHTAWQKEGKAVVQEIATEFTAVFIQEYRKRMGERFGLLDAKQEDFRDLIDPMLSMMQEHSLDFSKTFRLLCQFTSTDDAHFERFLDMLLPKSVVPQYLHEQSREHWTSWLGKYQSRLRASEATSGEDASSRRERMKKANPRFVLRQWVLEEAIERMEKKNDIAFLQRVLDMAVNPFEDYGEDLVDPQACVKPSKEVMEQRRLCDVGSKEMLGFQCSCSS